MEDTPISRRFIVAMLGLGLAFILMPQVLLAVEEHVSQAIEHTRQAIDYGKQGHADVLFDFDGARTRARTVDPLRAFLNTVRTERFDQDLAIKTLMPAIARAHIRPFLCSNDVLVSLSRAWTSDSKIPVRLRVPDPNARQGRVARSFEC